MHEPLSLASERWGELRHVYGLASDTPDLLRGLADEEPINLQPDGTYQKLCSSLYHQGDPNTASYAAVPHLVSIASRQLGESRRNLLYLCGWIETARFLRDAEMPADLADAYNAALRDAAVMMAAEAIEAPAAELPYVLSAIAAFRGCRALAENILSLDQLVEAIRKQDGDWPWTV
jgi:hypothetical protein